jgi:hypothetical protein
MAEAELDTDNDFDYLLGFLPSSWQQKAKELGALKRCRKIPNAEVLLRILLIHLAEGCSLRETAVRAQKGNLAHLSDVAVMNRLRASGEWFRWMNTEIMRAWVTRQPGEVFVGDWNVRVVDGTRIKEPVPTGSTWKIHYSIGLPSLLCDELVVTENQGKGNGESLCRFDVKPKDLLIGDRAYGVRPGLFHVVDHGGDVLVRFAMSNLPLSTPRGKKFNLLPRLRRLTRTKIGDWAVSVCGQGFSMPGRVCAIKKSRQAAEKARKQVIRQAQKGCTKPKPETLEAAGYIYVFTTVDSNRLTPTNVLEMYRGRWQIELVFKRLKSVLGLGHLRKTDVRAATAWLHGKLFVAFLLEALIRHGESFFPWGYPICQTGR